jgi:hypothetical protein
VDSASQDPLQVGLQGTGASCTPLTVTPSQAECAPLPAPSYLRSGQYCTRQLAQRDRMSHASSVFTPARSAPTNACRRKHWHTNPEGAQAASEASTDVEVSINRSRRQCME